MSRFSGKVVVVTGAAGGIGRALALELAKRGVRGLVLADIDTAKLDDVGRQSEALGAATVALTLDVGDPIAFANVASTALARFGVVHQLYNNAGIAFGSVPLLQMREGQFERMMQINFWGVVNGTRVFLPHLIASGSGLLVNISSLNGLMAQGGSSAYCASKFAVRGFTESIRVEMLLAEQPVDVVLVHPGGVKTNIASAGLDHADDMTDAERFEAEKKIRVYNEKLLTMSPADAANEILDGIERRRNRIVVTSRARWVDRLIRLIPNGYPLRVAAFQKKTFSKHQ